MSETKNFLETYEFHGITFNKLDEWSQADCPFCGKENHFFVEGKTGRMSCKVCNATGNLYNFIQQLWQQSFDETWKSLKASDISGDVQSFADDRGISLKELKRWGFCMSIVDQVFMLPQHNTKKHMANLCRVVWDGEKQKWQVYGTKHCKQHPFGTTLLSKEHTTLWVTEGPWDAMALSEALNQVRQTGKGFVRNASQSCRATHGVIAIPGAMNFQKEFLDHFTDHSVNLVFDNDHPKPLKGGKHLQPGWDGMKKVVKLAYENDKVPKTFNKIWWGEKGPDLERADGYDVRDLLREKELTQALNTLQSLLKPVEAPKEHGTSTDTQVHNVESIEPVHRETFENLATDFASILHLNTAMYQTLAVSIATVLSTPMKSDEQLYFRIIGPPGSGKTTIAECLSPAKEFCFPQSILTGFHSGYTGGKGGAKKNASLIPDMNGKCIIIKDADTILSSSSCDRILSELRDIYDGVTRARWRNRQTYINENLQNTFLLCGTDALRGLNRTFLGERFLDIDIMGNSDRSKYLSSAMHNARLQMAAAVAPEDNDEGVKPSRKLLLKQATYGYLIHLRKQYDESKLRFPEISQTANDSLESLAQLLALMRARVQRDRDEICYRPRAELSTRLGGQFVKLAVCLCYTLQKEEVDDEVLNIIRKVVHDTATSFQFEIAERMATTGNGLSTRGITVDLNISESTTRRAIADMQELDIIEHREIPNRSGVGGRNIHQWFLTEGVSELFHSSGLIVKPRKGPPKKLN